MKMRETKEKIGNFVFTVLKLLLVLPAQSEQLARALTVIGTFDNFIL